MNRSQILDCYMIFGGVPFYWSLLNKDKSLAQNVDHLLFSSNGPLRNEFDNLYKALFSKPAQYIDIIKAISKVNRGISRDEISRITGIESSGSLSKKLLELENCGFIRKYVPYGYKNKNSLYQLMDNFTFFYYKFMEDLPTDEKYWSNHILSPVINTWSGIAFERVCLEHISEIKMALGINGVYTEVNSWQCQKNLDEGIFGSQIDLLIARKDQVINICEMKYSQFEYIVDSNVINSMNKKISDFKNITGTKHSIHKTLITTYGVEENSYSKDFQSILTSDDLFKSA